MPRSIRFHLDEHVSSGLADGLRRRGIDVSTTSEAGLNGESDAKQLDFARTQGRVLCTSDSDFLRLHANGVEHAGIAYCHQQDASIGLVIRGLLLIWEILEPEEMSNKVEYL